MDWFYLFIAGFFEVAWAVGLKFTEGFTRLWPSVFTIIAMAFSFILLAQALKTIRSERVTPSGPGSGRPARR